MPEIGNLTDSNSEAYGGLVSMNELRTDVDELREELARRVPGVPPEDLVVPFELEPEQVRAVADASGLAPEGESRQVELGIEFVGIAPADEGRISIKSISRRKVVVRFRE